MNIEHEAYRLLRLLKDFDVEALRRAEVEKHERLVALGWDPKPPGELSELMGCLQSDVMAFAPRAAAPPSGASARE